MTDAQPDITTRPRRRKPSAFPVAAGSLAAFMGLFGFLAYQLRTGHDPALGNQVVATAAAPPAKRLVIKRVEDRMIITKVLPARGESDDGGSVAASVPVVVQGPAPVVAAPAPSAAAPATAAAPAPAPAPAPVVTRTS